MERGLKDVGLDFTSLEDPGDRFQLKETIGTGVNSTVHSAEDSEAGGRLVAVKVQTLTDDSKASIEDEYKILRDLSEHPNLPDFYGAYRKEGGGKTEIWFVMELCDGGPVTDLLHSLQRQTKKLTEIHIAFILKEVIKALLKLHENHVVHRDIKGSNILLTKNGEVKLVDFGISRELSSTLGKCQSSIGSPSWMAPEVVISKSNKSSYDNRADVWALGITAIELGDGKAPYEDMHPTRALFQIVRNPPPTLYRPANWTQSYNDFIAECLEKNPDHRPYMTELIEHPFIQELPENDFHLNAELKTLLENVTDDDKSGRRAEVGLRKGCIKKGPSLDPEPMYVEDLAGLELINEDNILQQLEERFKSNNHYTFVGDVLLFLNPNKSLDIYGFQNYGKYKYKSRSDNEPHIFTVADSAYQDMLHHDTPQHIVITGETMSGKTSQFNQIVKHLLYLGTSGNKVGDKLKKAVDLIQAFGNAATPLNSNSTRYTLFTQLTYSSTGKTSGAIFWLYQLEKWRVTGNRSPYHANFHIFYYFYDGLSSEGRLDEYFLEGEKSYCYLRRAIDEGDVDPKVPPGPRDKPESNAATFKKIKEYLAALQFEEEEQEVIWKVLAAVILLGEIEYKENEDGNADISDSSIVDNVATLLGIDGKKLAWSLCNYCVIEKDTAARRSHSRPEALAARNVLAQTLYTRLIDWIINVINYKLSFSRAVYGDHHYVSILDLYGFECYQENGLEQLFVNSLNEQLQYFYIQKMFIAEIQEEEEEEMQLKKFQFYNNKDTMDEIFNKPYGIMHILDEANKLNVDSEFVIDCLDKKSEGSYVKSCGEEEFSIAHYTGKVTYDSSAMCSKNRDFLPPEITEVLRFSQNPNIKQLFTNKLNRTGNLTLNTESLHTSVESSKKRRWGAALLNDANRRTRSYNTASKGEFSQTRGIRTASATFRSTSLELLRVLATGSTHFVRCLRTDLSRDPGTFQQSIVRQQLRAMSVIDTAKARQSGFSHRITFPQFLQSINIIQALTEIKNNKAPGYDNMKAELLKAFPVTIAYLQYKFLAFDFDENVEDTKDNCRLLLIRMKLEGWHLGNTKVFLKYYNEEYLSRMYETQVKKIIKVQSMLRSFLAKRNVANKKQLKSGLSIPETAEPPKIEKQDMSYDEAAVIIQKNIKGYVARKKYGPLINASSDNLDEETVLFIRRYFNRWKAKSLFQVLILYRAAKYQEFIYFCQQVHLYNQNVVSSLRFIQQEKVDVNNLIECSDPQTFVGEETPSVWKIPFRIKDFPFCESSHLRDTVAIRITPEQDVPWDDPFKKLDKGCQTLEIDPEINDAFTIKLKKNERFNNFISTPYCRDPKVVDNKYKEQSYKYIEDEDCQDEPVVEEGNLNCQPSRAEGTPASDHRGNARPRPQSPIRRPPSPGVQVTEFDGFSRSKLRQTGNINANQIQPTSYREKLQANKPNPIAELELIGKRVSVDAPDSEEPPFNFQAMLRKTNHNRKSLKRQAPVAPCLELAKNEINISDSTNDKTTHSPVIKTVSPKGKAPSPPTSRQKPFIRKDSFDKVKKMVGITLDFGNDDNLDHQRNITDNGTIYEENGNTLYTTEILPGFIVVGGPTIDL